MINKMTKDKKKMAEQFLNHALGFIYLLTGEEYTILRKNSPRSSIHRLTGEVPTKCDDVTVYFSMDEWEFIGDYEKLYKDIVIEDQPTLRKVDVKVKKSSENGHSDDGTDMMSNRYEAEGERGENTVQRGESDSDLCAGEDNADIALTEDSSAKSPLDLPEKDTSDNINTGLNEENSYVVIKCEEGEDGSDENNTQQIETTCDLDSAEENLYSVVKCEEAGNDMRQIVTTSDLSSGSCEESSYVVVKYEEREDERNESDIEQMINTSDLITDVSVSNDIPGKHQSAVTYTKKYSPENPSISQSFQNYSKNNLTYNEYSFQNYNQTLYSRKETFDCSKNLNITGNETQLDNHQIIHPINKQLCPDLGKWFTQKSDLLKHKIINAEEKTFSCSECGKCFAHRSRLFRHKIIHTGGKPFSCLECGKCFTQKSHLNTHQKIHTGERIFSCSDCGKWFTQKSDLLKHKRIHTGEKPFLCTECGKCFTQKSHLNIHLKIHTGEKIFLCSECGKWFTQKSDFYKHKRIHTGEKPFSCSDCGKCFAQQSGLLKHKRSIHKTDYLPVLNVVNSLPGTESFIDIR